MKVGLTFRNLRENERKIAPYENALRAAGLDPVLITPRDPRSLEGLKGLVLSGGSDINPALYGEGMHGSEDVNDERDKLELERLKDALDADMPVLAICRGVQLLNVAHGGSLIQDLPASAGHEKRDPAWKSGHHPAAHVVEVLEGSKLAAIVGGGEHEVNSRHHQAACRVGDGLRVSARSADGVIEGLERSDKTFVVGVQWHPEDRVQVSEADRKLFEAFRDAVRA